MTICSAALLLLTSIECAFPSSFGGGHLGAAAASIGANEVQKVLDVAIHDRFDFPDAGNSVWLSRYEYRYVNPSPRNNMIVKEENIITKRRFLNMELNIVTTVGSQKTRKTSEIQGERTVKTKKRLLSYDYLDMSL